MIYCHILWVSTIKLMAFIELLWWGKGGDKLLSILDDSSHPLQDTLNELRSSFSDRPQMCEGEVLWVISSCRSDCTTSTAFKPNHKS